MPFNGAGLYSAPGADYPVAPMTLIQSALYNDLIADLSTAMSLCITKDGQQTITNNIPFNNFVLTGLGSGLAARTRSANIADVQDGLANWVVAGGTADALTAAYGPALTALVDGQLCNFRAFLANATTAPTFAPNGLVARPITRVGGVALQAGDIAGVLAEYTVRYNLANLRWELLNPSQPPVNSRIAALVYVFDGGGMVLTTGVKGDLLIPFGCTINSVTLEADQSGSIVIDIWKKTYTLSAPPVVANTITAAALPTLAAAQSSQDAALAGWTVAVAPNDMLRFNINSVATCTRVTLTLKVTKT